MPLAVIFIDQATKWGVRQGTPAIIGPFRLEEVINPNGAFSLPLPAMVLTLIWLTILGYLALKLRQTKAQAAILLVIGGGLSNLLDRLVAGGVRDIMQLGDLFFNVADGAIVIGALAVVVILISGEITGAHSSST